MAPDARCPEDGRKRNVMVKPSFVLNTDDGSGTPVTLKSVEPVSSTRVTLTCDALVLVTCNVPSSERPTP